MKSEGATLGAMQSVDNLGRILGPVFGGVLYSLSLALPYYAGGGINLLFFILAVLII